MSEERNQTSEIKRQKSEFLEGDRFNFLLLYKTKIC